MKKVGIDLETFSEGAEARSILRMGHPALRVKCTDVDPSSDEAFMMMRTMAASVITQGFAWGLAAPQVGFDKRILYYAELDADRNPQEHYFLFNARYEKTTDEVIPSAERCLSVPGLVGVRARYKSIRLQGILYDGTSFTPVDRVLDTDDARLFQHEIDHLDGILYTDHLNSPQSLYYVEEFQEFILPQMTRGV
jgi:peptide deformylase